jgi:hypothetical protein
MATTLERITFRTTRLLDFCSETDMAALGRIWDIEQTERFPC